MLSDHSVLVYPDYCSRALLRAEIDKIDLNSAFSVIAVKGSIDTSKQLVVLRVFVVMNRQQPWRLQLQ